MLIAAKEAGTMIETGFWALFWATGLPEAWLGTRIEVERQKTEVFCAAPPEDADEV